MLVWPKLPFVQAWEAERLQALAKQQQVELQRQRENARFVFVAPRVDLKALKAPERAELSDIDRKARTMERAEKPTNTMPFARGNTFEKMEGAPPRPESRAAERRSRAQGRPAMALRVADGNAGQGRGGGQVAAARTI